MTSAEWCVFGALMLCLLTIAPVKWIGFRHFDNAKPRDPAFFDDPLRARALGAHLNGIEAFPFFATAVLLAEFRHLSQNRIDGLATAFVVIRLLFVFAYLSNRSTIRTLLWNLG